MSRVPLVHAVTDDRVLGLPDFLGRARAVGIGPEVAIHLRGRLDGGPLLALTDQVRALIAASGTRLLVHDRLDVALLAGADGLHLPAAGLPVEAARRELGPGPLLGRSVHSPEEAAAAFAGGADYVFLGPIWETASHPARRPLGVTALTAATAGGAAAGPVVAIGGVTAERAAAARAAGAGGVAAITALWDAGDPAAAAHALLLSLRR